MRLAVRRLDPAARLPVRAHDDDAGYDLHALEPATLERIVAVANAAEPHLTALVRGVLEAL